MQICRWELVRMESYCNKTEMAEWKNYLEPTKKSKNIWRFQQLLLFLQRSNVNKTI